MPFYHSNKKKKKVTNITSYFKSPQLQLLSSGIAGPCHHYSTGLFCFCEIVYARKC